MRLRALLFLLLSSFGCARAEDPVQSIRADDIRKHQTYLASDELEGRGAGSEGGKKASAYLADRVKAWGFQAAGTDGSYFQPFGEGRRNVAAFWPGREGNEYVVVGAHYDHLGRQGEKLFHGADDNASGTSTLLDVAEALSKTKFRRGVLVMWFDEEENQLKGSRWWCAHPTRPIDLCFAMLNCDMIGRNDPAKIFVGVEKEGGKEPKYPKLAAEIRGAEAAAGATFDWTEFDRFIKHSDHWPFMEQGVPAMFFTGGIHADWHKEGDLLEKINFAKEERIGRILYSLLSKVAERAEPLK
ncbi:MAG: M28 family peptidase [Planctomycetes bacterium]|nr:M28 family peptidase [Planctomycetota bacterium]